MSPPTPKRKKRGFGLWPLVCEKTIKQTHTIYTHKLWKKKSAFLQNIHLMGRSGQNGL